MIKGLHDGNAGWRFTQEQEARFAAKTCLIAAQGEQQDSVDYDIGFPRAHSKPLPIDTSVTLGWTRCRKCKILQESDKESLS